MRWHAGCCTLNLIGLYHIDLTQLTSRENQRLREVFGIFSRFSYLLRHAGTCSDLLGCIRLRSDTFGSVRKRSDILEFCQIFPTFFALVPNTGEANDEMYAPMSPKICEMWSLKLENNNRFRRALSFNGNENSSRNETGGGPWEEKRLNSLRFQFHFRLLLDLCSIWLRT